MTTKANTANLKLLGSDGLNSDETAARYYVDSDGYIVREFWGDYYTVSRRTALDSLHAEHNVTNACHADPLRPARLAAIEATIKAIEAVK